MPTDNPYRAWVARFAELLQHGVATDIQALKSANAPAPDAPRALIFAPHPDDEVIIGGLPLRLLRELGYAVDNVAVTLGSRRDRRAERWQELQDACNYLGFGLISTGPEGLEDINLTGRREKPEQWAASVAVIADLLRSHRPAVIFLPHDADWNRTHIGTYQLVLEALEQMPADFSCQVVETEFWGAMDAPNLLVSSDPEQLGDLVAALSLHVGEVARNAYHLRLPAWMIDNVRRGGELVAGQGAAAPDCPFATLYRLRRWQNGELRAVLDGGRFVITTDELRALFV